MGRIVKIVTFFVHCVLWNDKNETKSKYILFLLVNYWHDQEFYYLWKIDAVTFLSFVLFFLCVCNGYILWSMETKTSLLYWFAIKSFNRCESSLEKHKGTPTEKLTSFFNVKFKSKSCSYAIFLPWSRILFFKN